MRPLPLFSSLGIEYICSMKKIMIHDTHELQQLVRTHIESIAGQKEGSIRIGLPGGRSAKHLVQAMLGLENSLFQRVRLYLLDERLTGELNKDTLLQAGLDKAIEDKRFDRTRLVIPRVGEPLLEGSDLQFDLIYLGIGEDGHMASLFPGSYPSDEIGQTALVTNSPKPPNERVTFTYKGFLEHAQKTPIHLLFLGEGKREALDRLLANTEKPESLPCSFFPLHDFPVFVITDLKE